MSSLAEINTTARKVQHYGRVIWDSNKVDEYWNGLEKYNTDGWKATNDGFTRIVNPETRECQRVYRILDTAILIQLSDKEGTHYITVRFTQSGAIIEQLDNLVPEHYLLDLFTTLYKALIALIDVDTEGYYNLPHQN